MSAGKLRRRLDQPTPARSLAFSPDETLLATFGSTGNVAVTEWASNRAVTNLLMRPPRHGGAGVVAFLPDGSRLAIGEDYGRINLLNWRTGTLITMTHLTESADAASGLGFSPTTGLLAVGFGAIVRFWAAASGQPRGQLTNQTGSVRGLAFSADGQLLASANRDQTLPVWRVADQAELGCWGEHEVKSKRPCKSEDSFCGSGSAWVLRHVPDTPLVEPEWFERGRWIAQRLAVAGLVRCSLLTPEP